MGKAKFSIKFYIATLFLFAMTIFGWYAIWFLHTNEILMEDNTPMPPETKTAFAVAIGVVVSSWMLSLLTMLRQIVVGSAFQLDENGISSTFTYMIVLAFIIVVPIKRIPFSAIRSVTEENDHMTLRLDKSKIDVCGCCRWLVSREYRLPVGFFTECEEWQRRLKRLYKQSKGE